MSGQTTLQVDSDASAVFEAAIEQVSAMPVMPEQERRIKREQMEPRADGVTW